MRINYILKLILSINIALFSSNIFAKTHFIERHDVKAFIADMVKHQGLKRKELISLFESVKFPEQVIRKSNKPAEAMTWEHYHRIFVTKDNIRDGVGFWHQYGPILERAHHKYGVPVEIIIATIGIESRYGRNSGKFRVIDSLTNLAFNFHAVKNSLKVN